MKTKLVHDLQTSVTLIRNGKTQLQKLNFRTINYSDRDTRKQYQWPLFFFSFPDHPGLKFNSRPSSVPVNSPSAVKELLWSSDRRAGILNRLQGER